MNSLSIAVSISVACYDLWSNCHWFLHFVSGQREGGRETKRLSLFMIFTYIYININIFSVLFSKILNCVLGKRHTFAFLCLLTLFWSAYALLNLYFFHAVDNALFCLFFICVWSATRCCLFPVRKPKVYLFQFWKRWLFRLFLMLIHFRVKITPNKTKETNRKPCCFKGCVKGVSFSVEAKQSLCFIVVIIIIFVCLFSIFPQSCFTVWLECVFMWKSHYFYPLVH